MTVVSPNAAVAATKLIRNIGGMPQQRRRLWDKFLKAANRFHLMTGGRQIVMAEDA